MKRLRKHYSGRTIRYYMCGEYGENMGRPHYHAVFFNLRFADQLYFKSSGGFKLYPPGHLTNSGRSDKTIS